MSNITLYDIPSKGRCACWTLNPWKTRLALNYKGVAYTTQWTEYPDIAPTMQSLGLGPNPEGTSYTIPGIRFPDGSCMMDSRKIATELEKRYPEPSMHLDAPELRQVEESLKKGFESLRPVFLPKVPDALLNPRSAEFFTRTRKERFGISLAEMEEKIGETGWKEAEPALQELGALLKAKGGPFILGSTVSYADFIIVGMIHFARRIHEDLYQRVIALEPTLKTLYEASAVWLERDDH